MIKCNFHWGASFKENNFRVGIAKSGGIFILWWWWWCSSVVNKKKKEKKMQLSYKLLQMLYLTLSVFILAQWHLASYQSTCGLVFPLLSLLLLVYSFFGKEPLSSTTLPLIESWLHGNRRTDKNYVQVIKVGAEYQDHFFVQQNFKDCFCKMASQSVEDCRHVLVIISIIPIISIIMNFFI